MHEVEGAAVPIENLQRAAAPHHESERKKIQLEESMNTRESRSILSKSPASNIRVLELPRTSQVDVPWINGSIYLKISN